MDTPTIGILGGYGSTGSVLTRLLLEQTSAHVIIGGRHILRAREAAREFNKQVGAERVCAAYAGASDPGSVARAFERVQLLIVASSTGRYAEPTAQAALQTGCDWLDIQYYTPKISALTRLRERIEREGRCFITDAGLHPGLPALMVRYAASQFDVLEAANVYAIVNPKGGFPKTPSTHEFARELMRFRYSAYRDGEWRCCYGFGAGDMRQADFGFGFGTRLCAPLTLEEMRALPEMFPTLQETGFYVAGFNWFVDWVTMPLLWIFGKVAPSLAVKPLASLLCWGTRLWSNPPYGAVIKLEACGSKGDERHRLSLQMFHADPYAFTAVSVTAGILQYLRGSARKPGLWFAGHLFDPREAIEEMRRMGVQVQCEMAPIKGTCPFCGR